MPAIQNASEEAELHIGRRIRSMRRSKDISLETLAASAGVTFQQIQKYERGNNRIAATRLWRIAQALDVPMGYFFEGLEPATT